jgi:hypothetical protein
MARLPSPGALIRFSEVLDIMGVGRAFNSFDQTELTAMGGFPQANMSQANSICMPYQREAVASKGTGAPGPGPGFNWTSTATVRWRPTRISEFADGYNRKPSVTGVASDVTGRNFLGDRCDLSITATGSDAWSSGSTPYYFYITGSGAPISPGVFDSWFVAPSNQGRDVSFRVFGLNSTGAWTVRVCDFEGCGNIGEISTVIKYHQ